MRGDAAIEAGRLAALLRESEAENRASRRC